MTTKLKTPIQNYNFHVLPPLSGCRFYLCKNFQLIKIKICFKITLTVLNFGRIANDHVKIKEFVILIHVANFKEKNKVDLFSP